MNEIETASTDPYLLGRFESFSDLVFGFVVPTLAINIKIPARPSDFVHSRRDLILFAAGFLFLCVLWLRHHRMMRRFFVGDTLSILLVFAVLGTVALYSYPFQLYLHFPDDPIALRAYAWGFAFLCFLYAFMAEHALRKVGAGWIGKPVRDARKAIVANGVAGVVMAAFPFVQTFGPPFFAVVLLTIVALRMTKPWIDAPLALGDDSPSLQKNKLEPDLSQEG